MSHNLVRANWILGSCVAIALVSSLFGLLQNRKLGLEKMQLQLQLQRLFETGVCDSPRSGDIVPPIDAETSQGKRVKISYAGTSKYLLFFLSFKCNECVRQLPDWSEIAKRAKAKNVMALGLVTDKKGDTTKVPNDGFEVLTISDAALLRAYRITVTPTVMLVSEQGRTEWVHAGSLSVANTQELLSVIGADTAIQ